jgi:hypothetical protein
MVRERVIELNNVYLLSEFEAGSTALYSDNGKSLETLFEGAYSKAARHCVACLTNRRLLYEEIRNCNAQEIF